jgi:phage gp29-like protein
MGIQEAGGGGRATSSSQQDMYTKSLRYVGNQICQYMNMYLIPRLVAYNFVTDKFPKLKLRNIGETKDLQMWASAIANLIAQNAITVDEETEQWVREQIDAPELIGGRPVLDGQPAPASPQKGDVRTTDPKQGQGNVPKGTNPQ